MLNIWSKFHVSTGKQNIDSVKHNKRINKKPFTRYYIKYGIDEQSEITMNFKMYS